MPCRWPTVTDLSTLQLMKSSTFLEQQSWSLVCLTHKQECFGPMPCKSLPLVTQCHVIGSSNCEAIWKWSLIMMFQKKTERWTNSGKWGYLWIAYSKVAAFMLDQNVSQSMSGWSHLQEPGHCEMEWNCAGLWGAPRFKWTRFSGAGFRGILFTNNGPQTSLWNPDCWQKSVLWSFLHHHTSCQSHAKEWSAPSWYSDEELGPTSFEEVPRWQTLKQQGRGTSATATRTDEKLYVVKWYDNKSGLLSSTVHSVHPEDTCQRWSNREKKYITVKRPSVVREYNAKMEGVDVSDRMIRYRMSANKEMDHSHAHALHRSCSSEQLASELQR